MTLFVKRIISYLIILSIGLIAALGILEIFVRVFFPQDDYMEWFLSDKRYGHINKSNFYQRYKYPRHEYAVDIRTNSMGLRDREYDLTRRDYKRVLLLGDSFTFGFGQNAEDLFDEKLERLLNGSGKKYFVINAGVGGWGTLQEATYARDHFEIFRPDIIVITFCGNDPVDDFLYPGIKPFQKWLFYFPWRKMLKDHSHLFRLLAKGYYKARWGWVMHAKQKERPTLQADIFREEAGAAGASPGAKPLPSQNFSTRKTESKEIKETAAGKLTDRVTFSEDWNNTLRYIREFHADFLKFNPNGILLVQASNPFDEDTRNHLKTLSNGKNLFYVDLYGEANKYRRDELNIQKLAGDGHWSQTMHSISAKKLYDKITQLKY